ncbi:cyclin-dependent kinase [Acrasis kona]|uniref:Cyclin-dependent kinase n=1 Tax=Acrasis kona TaxID=1008807 RepID=A0AAW2YN78_9EUKA
MPSVVIHNVRELRERYEKVLVVGEGAYGRVLKATERITKEIVALKSIPLCSGDKEGFPISTIREINQLKTFNHNNVLSLRYLLLVSDTKEGWATCSRSEAYLVFDYVPHDLTGIISDPGILMNEASIKSYMQQLLTAVVHVHSFGSMHCDIKSSNVLVKYDGTVKLADFGLARFKNPNPNVTYCNNVVTRWYRPPELLLGDNKYNEKIDVWAVGCILAEFMDRRPIYPGSDEKDMCARIFSMMGVPTNSTWNNVEGLKLYRVMTSGIAKGPSLRDHFASFRGFVVVDLLEALLQIDPNKRISAEQALRHPWFSQAPEPSKSALKLPTESRNESWVKKQFAEQEKRRMQSHQQQMLRNGNRKRSIDTLNASQPPPKKQQKITNTVRYNGHTITNTIH